MWNILLALSCGALLSLALRLPNLLTTGEAAVPGILLAFGVYFVLARRTFREVEGIFSRGNSLLQRPPPNFSQAIAQIEGAYKLAPYQLGVRSQIDTQIGVLYFLQKEFGRALPYFQRSLMFGYWVGGAMLGVIYYKRHDHVQMRKTFEVVTTRAKKQGLAWTLYAYLLAQIGERQAAQQVLVRAQKHVRGDPRVAEALLALQNGQKIRMRAYQEQWYQFHLERPPAQMQQGMGGPQRMSRQQRRGRW
jgi:tetratricopeptide (TPR) repeat protein